ncbi:MAG TPA: alpha/beta fold hydrolase [Vicinamibacterales bacterium]
MVREAKVTLGGQPTRYFESGAGWPVVLLHAFPLNAEMWRPQLERVPPGWRYIAPDLRGFGPGARPDDESLTMAELAADVTALLDHLGIEQATIGGLSMGGYVTLALFRAAPERFTGIVLADTRPQADTEEGRAGRRRMRELVRARGVGAVVDEMLPKLLGETTRRERAEVEAEVRRIAAANSPSAIAAALAAMMERPDSSALLPTMSCPALVIVGDEDVLTPPADAEAMDRQLPRSRLVTLPQAGHLSNLETPDAFASALADFTRSYL